MNESEQTKQASDIKLKTSDLGGTSEGTNALQSLKGDDLSDPRIPTLTTTPNVNAPASQGHALTAAELPTSAIHADLVKLIRSRKLVGLQLLFLGICLILGPV